MALADALEKRKKPDRSCLWAELLAAMPDEDRAVAEQYMEGGFPVSPLLGALRDEGYAIGDVATYRHRRGECACPSQNA